MLWKALVYVMVYKGAGSNETLDVWPDKQMKHSKLAARDEQGHSGTTWDDLGRCDTTRDNLERPETDWDDLGRQPLAVRGGPEKRNQSFGDIWLCDTADVSAV